FDPDKGDTLGQFILYAACAGQQKAALLGYSPLPQNLVEADFDAVRRIPGAPEPPAIEDCDNPHITGGDGGSGGGGGGGGRGRGRRWRRRGRRFRLVGVVRLDRDLGLDRIVLAVGHAGGVGQRLPGRHRSGDGGDPPARGDRGALRRSGEVPGRGHQGHPVDP